MYKFSVTTKTKVCFKLWHNMTAERFFLLFSHSLCNQVSQVHSKVRVLQIRLAQLNRSMAFIRAEKLAKSAAALVNLKNNFDSLPVWAQIGFQLIEPPAKFAGRSKFKFLHKGKTPAEFVRVFAINFEKRKTDSLNGIQNPFRIRVRRDLNLIGVVGVENGACFERCLQINAIPSHHRNGRFKRQLNGKRN